jgi:hypothetical protein
MNVRWMTSAALLWTGCAAVYFLTAPGRIDIIDGGIRYDVTASLIESGRPVVRDPYLPSVMASDGFRYAFYPLGTSLTAVPFVKLGAWLGHNSEESKQFAFSLMSVPFSAATVALLFLIYGRLGVGMNRALAWSLVAAFCTPLWPYAGSSFDTGLQAFWLACAVWAAIEAIAANSSLWAVVSGTSFALLFNTQEVYAVLGACVAIAIPVRWRSIAERLRQPVVQQIVLGMIIGIVLVLSYNAFKFGHPLDTGRTSVPHPLLGNPLIGLAGLLISPAKSILLYSPTYVLGLAGLRRLIRIDGSRFGPLAACVALHIALVSTLRFWAGEWAWGPRYLVASLPLVCIALPFSGGVRPLVRAMCALGLLVQLLAISVDHQRFYFERSLAPYFWLDERVMYTQSPLFARPAELLAIWRRRDLEKARALVPGPRPSSMTAWIYGPPPALLPQSPEWMRQYLVFLVPRPWPLWSRYLRPEYQPGRVGLMTVAGAGVAFTSFGLLFGSLYGARRRNATVASVETRISG